VTCELICDMLICGSMAHTHGGWLKDSPHPWQHSNSPYDETHSSCALAGAVAVPQPSEPSTLSTAVVVLLGVTMSTGTCAAGVL
jgi:hypothetical protein